MEDRIIIEADDLIRVLNNVAIGLHSHRFRLDSDVTKHLEMALSWAWPLLGIEHEFFTHEGRVLQLIPRARANMNRLDPDT